MKKLFAFLLALLVLLTACVEKAPAEEPMPDEWGLTLALEFTDMGKKLVFTRSDAVDGELDTGSYYVIERLEGDVWEEVPFRAELDGENIAWTAEAWLIPMGESEFDLDWSFLYGELPVGEYRIGKEVMYRRAPGDFDKKMYYALFAVID